MHSCEPLPAAPATGPTLLQQLGRLIIRARSASPAPAATPAARAARVPSRDVRDRLLQAKLRAANPSTSAQVSQPKPEPEKPGVEAQLQSHVTALWTDQVPVCIEVLLAPDCAECFTALSRMDGFDKSQGSRQGLLLERWTMRARVNKSHEKPAFITSQWLLNAVRSQLHFSQLAAWLARLTDTARPKVNEQCNYKKLESNCDETDPANEGRQLNIVYSIKIPGEHKITEFTKPPTDHCFPITDIGDNVYLNVVVESLPRIHDIPTVKCTCQKRRASKEVPVNAHEELVGKLNDLSIGQKYAINSINTLGNSSRRLSIITNQNTVTEYMIKNSDDDDDKKDDKIVDDRMHTNCSENGKHKCSCDEESDRSSNNFNNEPKKLDERRLKEIAKYKRRLRKESKWKKHCDSTSSEGDGLKRETHTSIPILQASRFDRFRAIGCYRNQTYLTLPASRIESKSPFLDSISIPATEFKKTVSISTQTDDILCQCGVKVNFKCESCRMVRSDANYNLASLNQDESGGRRKREEDTPSSKKLKCDNLSNNSLCDSFSVVDDSSSNNDLIKRPKLRRFYPVTDRIERILTDRCNNDAQKDMEQLHLKTDDSVFVVPKVEAKRQKTFSISEDYVTLEKCDYGTFDRCDMDSPSEELSGFQYPDLKAEDLDISNKTPNRYHNFTKSDSSENSHNSNQNANLNEISPESDHPHYQYSPLKHNFSKNSSNLNQHLQDFNQHSQNLNQNPQNLNQNPQNLNQHPQNFNQNPQNLNQHHQHQTDDRESLDHKNTDHQVPSPSEMDRFRWRFDSAASMVFHTKTGLPLTSSPAPLRRGNNCFDFDDSINGISGIKSALFHPISPPVASPPAPRPPRPKHHRLRVGPSTGLLGSFEESALKGRLEPVATVAGFSAELGASGAFCPPHRRLPVTVFFYAPGGTNAPYMGHINLGAGGYRVARSGTIQVSLFNPHGTLVKMFVVLYELTGMPPLARTFLRQRTLYMPAGADPPASHHLHKWLRYLIHLRFMTSKSGKLYLHTDIRILVSRKADLDTATAHSALFRPIPTNQRASSPKPTNQNEDSNPTNKKPWISTNENVDGTSLTNSRPNRVFGGCGDLEENRMREIGYDNQNGVSYELRSFTYAPDNPRYSPR